LSGDEIRARVAPDGAAEWWPQSTVVVAGALDQESDSCRGCCPVLNFFVSPTSAGRWLSERPQVSGTVISMGEAAAAGRAVFGDVLTQKEETMNHEQAQANLQLVLDWIDALRRGDVDSITEKFHPDVVWVDVAGAPACEGREQVLAWLRSAPAQIPQVEALELLADDDHAVLGVRDHARHERAGVRLDGQLFTVFTLRDGQIVHLRDHAHRAEALADAGRDDYQWR
jgi:ketosteroid isomerase-like protein